MYHLYSDTSPSSLCITEMEKQVLQTILLTLDLPTLTAFTLQSETKLRSTPLVFRKMTQCFSILKSENTDSHIPVSFFLSYHWLFTLLLFSHSVMSYSVTQCTAAHQDSLSFTLSQSLLKLMSIGSMMPSNNLILCCPLLLLPSIFPSISAAVHGVSKTRLSDSTTKRYLKFSVIEVAGNSASGHDGITGIRLTLLP